MTITPPATLAKVPLFVTVPPETVTPLPIVWLLSNVPAVLLKPPFSVPPSLLVPVPELVTRPETLEKAPLLNVPALLT